MSYFEVVGGRRLLGSTEIHGSKNSVLPILSAAVLCRGKSIIHNCPDLTDVRIAVKILKEIGCRVEREEDTIIIDSTQITNQTINKSLMKEMRSSVIFMGAIAARCGNVLLSMPGGCELGARPIDLHIESLRKLGYKIEQSNDCIMCSAEALQGTQITLPIQSVGATENIMLAATACSGTTTIVNAAREPEIKDLQEFLRKCGFDVNGAGGNVIQICGGKGESFAEHTVIPDRIVAATCLSACAAVGGSVEIKRIIPEHISSVISVLSGAGADIRIYDNRLSVKCGRLKGAGEIRTMPYPEFPTDAQPPMAAAFSLADGRTKIIETIFDNRFKYIEQLVKMGADITCSGRTAVINGVRSLVGGDMEAADLRGGAALITAAAAAYGISHISNIHHIDRGYDRMENIMGSLGVNIKRVEG